MKKRVALFAIAGLLAATMFNPAKAYKPDTVYIPDTARLLQNAEIPTEVFNGTETNLIDSTITVTDQITDTALKQAVTDVITQALNTPKGGGVKEWIAYALALLFAGYGIYKRIQYKQLQYKAFEYPVMNAQQAVSKYKAEQEHAAKATSERPVAKPKAPPVRPDGGFKDK